MWQRILVQPVTWLLLALVLAAAAFLLVQWDVQNAVDAQDHDTVRPAPEKAPQ